MEIVAAMFALPPLASPRHWRTSPMRERRDVSTKQWTGEMIDWNAIHQFLRGVHILAGGVGLLLFWVPVVARKGSRLHIASGKAFVWVAYFVSATAAISCLWALSSPIAFSGITRQLTADEMQQLSMRIRFLFTILATLMCWLVATLQLGIYAIRTKENPNSTRRRVMAFQSAAIVCSVSLIAFGASQLMSVGAAGYWAHVVLGIISFSDVIGQYRYLRSDPSVGKAWWLKHMECMLGAGVAFYTAFFVFGFSRMMPLQLEGVWRLVPWVLPSLVGTPLITIWVGRYKRRFAAAGDASKTAMPPTL